jgi:predicted nucleic acid-binding Zn ribbon protein
MTSRRAPRPVAAAVNAALERVEPETLLAHVQTVWGAAVGEAIAAQASPISERDGVVTVACTSSTWAHELDLLSGQILAKLRSEMPSEAPLTELRFTAAQNPAG